MIRYPSFGASAALAATDDPDGLAIVDGDDHWTWRELDDRVRLVVGRLGEAGVTPGSRVALVAPPSAAAVAVLHALARIGAVAAPLDDRMTDAELAVALEVVDPDHVVMGTERMLAGRPGPAAVALAELVRGATNRTGRAPRVNDVAGADRDDSAPAVVVLTSGTTGRPKGVLLSHAAMEASARSWLEVLPPATGWLLALGPAHVAGLGILWRAALSGVPLVVRDRPDAAGIVGALAAAPHPSHVSLVPTTLGRILDTTDDGPPPGTVRAVPLGGGAIPAWLVERAVAAGWPVVPTYGLTEAGSGVTALPTRDAATHPETAGLPLPGVRLRIVDAEADGIGDIQVETRAALSGYLGDPAATAAALTPDGWLRTGDLGRLDADGRLAVADRRLDRIVRGGENVSPAEVEAVLAEHPAVADAAVIGRPDPEFGHVPVAVVVLRPDAAEPSDAELARFCRDRLSRAKVPVAFERWPAVPRTPGGRLRRALIRDRLTGLDGSAGAATPAAAPSPASPEEVRA